MRLARKSSSQAAVMRLRHWESFPGALRIRLLAMCLSVTKLPGALSVRTRPFVVAEDHVHNSMQAVFDGPMVADHRARPSQRANSAK